MNKWAKRGIIAVLAVGVAGGGAFGGYKIYQNYHSGLIGVYDISSVGMTDYWGDSSSTDGIVSTDKLQTVYLSDTQVVKDVAVKKGQSVKVGDVLLSYDSTLTEIDLKRKEIEVQQQQLELQAAQKELKEIKRYKPGVPIPGSTSGGGGSSGKNSVKKTEVVEEPIPTYDGLVLLSGDGSEEHPYRYTWLSSFRYSDDFIAAVMQGQQEAYAVFQLSGSDAQLKTDTSEPVTDDPTPEDPDSTGSTDSDPEPTTPEDPDSSGSTDSDPEPTPPEDPDSSGSTGSDPEPEPPEDPDSSGSTGSDPEPEPPEDPDGSESTTPPTEPEPIESTDPLDESSGDESAEPVQDAATQGATEASAAALGSYIAATMTSSTITSGIDDDTVADPYGASWTMQFQHTVTGYRYVVRSMSVGGVERVVSPALPEMTEEEYPSDGTIDDGLIGDFDMGGDLSTGITYTSAELAKMIQEKETEIRDKSLSIRQAKLEYEKLRQEMNNSTVCSTVDGTVTLVSDPKDADSSDPLLKVSGGGGYLVKGSVSELMLDTIMEGETMKVSSYDTGESCEGTVVALSDYPAAGNNYYYGEGNSNVSYYQFTLLVPAEANLQENGYVSISYSAQQSGSGSSIYLQKSFVRAENGRSYIYVDNDGTLEKRYVTTGKDVWGEYVEIKSGLTADDLVAFPYGQKVREGAQTVTGSVDELYGY